MIDVRVKLTRDQQRQLVAGEPLVVTILPPGRTRREAAVSARNMPKEAERVITAWNSSDYILVEAVHESRNNGVTDQEVQEHNGIILKAVEELGAEKLIQTMQNYFEACRDGDHLWGGRNHGYASLIGFLRRVRQHHRKGGKPLWWDRRGPNDPHAALTQKVADLYAQRFLGRRRYNLKAKGSQYRAFMAGADWVELRVEKTTFSAEKLIGLALDEIADRWEDMGRVSPSKLALDVLWTDYLPQRLRRMFGG